MRRVEGLGWTGAGVLLGALACALLASQAGLLLALGLVSQAGGRAFALLVPYALSTVLYAIPWGLLLDRSVRPRWRAIVGSRFAASAVNVVVPSGLVGEPVRLRAVADRARAQAGEALVWDRALYLGASALFMLFALAGSGSLVADRIEGLAALAAAGAYVAIGAGLVLVARFAPARRAIERALGRNLPVQAARPSGSIALAGLSIHFAGRLLHASEIWVAAWALGIPLGLAPWLLAAGAVFFTAAALPIVPAQVGVQEVALAGALATAGIDASGALAIALLLRLRQLAFVPLGFALAASPVTAARPDVSHGE